MLKYCTENFQFDHLIKIDCSIVGYTERGDTLFKPNVLNHNIETVPRIFRFVRPKGSYERSLHLLKRSQDLSPEIPTKSGMMVGLGETWDELRKTMEDLREVGCNLLTIGQYLRPSKFHHPVKKFYHPDEFSSLKELGQNLGFQFVASGPMVRSSYQAEEQAMATKTVSH